MAKVKKLFDQSGVYVSWAFECPACNMWHSCNETHPSPNAPTWDFNGDVDRPTFSPSVLVRYPQDGVEKVCHSFVENGQIRFLGDCSHDLRGQTVPLPDLE